MNTRAHLLAVLASAAMAAALYAVAPAQNTPEPRPTPASAPSHEARSALPKTPEEAQALVRRVIERQMDEDEAGGGPAFLWIQKENGKRGILTKEMVDTKEGIVARLIAINDHPLTPEERQADDDRLNKLLKDPQARAQKLKQQQEDEKRTRKMVRALSDAFAYEPDGAVPGSAGELVRLKFQPDRRYDPPSRDLQVFQGMQGEMLIDPRAQRLVEIEARLFRDVNFGWGILGHLDKGGQFTVRQADVTGKGHWQVIAMKLNFDGKAIIFKPIHIRDDVSASNFRVVPGDMSFAQGVELLRKQESAVAEKK